MSLFNAYIHPLILWLQAHPQSALVITFLIALFESLVIIGGIIPGSLSMTAIGILAGSGFIRIDLTYLAAALGAIAGDGISYTVGCFLSDKLQLVWPFSRYPRWIDYSKNYFERHGGISIIIGRFIGPLRAMIPVIAGMMHMNRVHFFIANVISGLLWSLLFITPGVVIGVISSELSPENATRLFVVFIVALILIWAVSYIVRFLFIRAIYFLRRKLHDIWVWSKKHPMLAGVLGYITPKHERDHYQTAALATLFVFALISFILITTLVIHAHWIAPINEALYLLLESIHAHGFNIFFIALRFFIAPLPLTLFSVMVMVVIGYYRDWRLFITWLSLNLTSALLLACFTTAIPIPSPMLPLNYYEPAVYPSINLTLAVSFYGFLLLYLSIQKRTYAVIGLTSLLYSLLILLGLTMLYLGGNWVTSILAAYSLGAMISIAHWMYYRLSINPTTLPPSKSMVWGLISMVLLISTSAMCWLNFQKKIPLYQPVYAHYTLTESAWWTHEYNRLPVYRTNRMGNVAEAFNIQYAGTLTAFQKKLEQQGWKIQSNSFLKALLIRAGGKSSSVLPLITPLYLNKKPVLVMSYQPRQGPVLLLRLWKSNYFLRNQADPIWLGRVDTNKASKITPEYGIINHIMLLNPLLSGLQSFKYKSVTRLSRPSDPFLTKIASPVLIIREKKRLYEE